jgi:hypothetical protein
MRRILFVTTAMAVLMVSSARAQLVGQPSGQGGAALPPPNVATAPPTVPNTSGTSQSLDSTLPLEGSSTELQGSASPSSPSPRVRSLNQLTRPPAAIGQGPERPAGPLR